MWEIDPLLSKEAGERVFRHRCPVYGPLILSDSQCGIYDAEDFVGFDEEEGEETGCSWCGSLPPNP